MVVSVDLCTCRSAPTTKTPGASNLNPEFYRPTTTSNRPSALNNLHAPPSRNLISSRNSLSTSLKAAIRPICFPRKSSLRLPRARHRPPSRPLLPLRTSHPMVPILASQVQRVRRNRHRKVQRLPRPSTRIPHPSPPLMLPHQDQLPWAMLNRLLDRGPLRDHLAIRLRLITDRRDCPPRPLRRRIRHLASPSLRASQALPITSPMWVRQRPSVGTRDVRVRNLFLRPFSALRPIFRVVQLALDVALTSRTMALRGPRAIRYRLGTAADRI